MTETTKEEVTQTTEAQEAPQASSGAELTVSDLSTMKTIIDIAAQRGTFKPNEMAAVGALYSKLGVFLDAVEQQSKGQ